MAGNENLAALTSVPNGIQQEAGGGGMQRGLGFLDTHGAHDGPAAENRATSTPRARNVPSLIDEAWKDHGLCAP